MGNLPFTNDFPEGFRDVVGSGWNLNVNGCAMYRVVKQLKGLKTPIRKLLHDQGNLHERVNRLRVELDEAQKAIDRNPSCSLLCDENAHYLLAFKEASLDEERFLRQKCKIEWLNARDSNTAYFHKIVKSKCVRNIIEIVWDSSNVLHEGNAVVSAFVSHYEQFLGLEGTTTPLDDHGLFSRVLSDHNAEFMVKEVSDSEIKGTLFSMGDDKAPGPDGFTAAFFKRSWDIMGGEVTIAIRDFFSNGKLLKEINHTIISLIPKVSTPTKINYYRPISCCNVLFKCISKIIANRIKGYLGDLVSINQSAFVLGRRISDNILFTQEPMRNYHRKRGPLHLNLTFRRHMTRLTGDSLVLMVTCMAGLMRRVQNTVDFQYHHLYEQQRIVNLCFAYDLFLFARGHPNSVRVIMDALEEFKNVSGLVPSIPKSIAFFCNVLNALKTNILGFMPFAEDCKVLIEKLESHVNDWRNKFLSLAGRLQLMRSVLSSMYWASVFILPARIISELEQLMRGFLWCQGEMKKGKAKVAWEAVCLPQREGGLGIRRIKDFDIALMATHIWSFWDVPCLGDVSWGWRKLLQIRPHVRPFIWHKINNGRSTSMWFDRWADPCPLRDMFTVRNIVRSDFSLSDTVSDLISNGSWRWPHDWSSRFPNVVNIPISDINNDLDDVIVWRDVQGVFQCFSVAEAWDSLRLRADVVDWYHVVWFPDCIPRHAIHMWLVIKEKLKTQDRLRQWDVGPSINLNLLRCPLCEMVPDSHSHLFFECSFASQVWFQVRAFTGMSSVPPRLVDVLAFLIPTKGSSVSNVISRIVLAATAYCLWNERNSRLFKKKKSTVDQIVQLITSLVRMKLVTFKFKKMTTGSHLLLDQWKIPSSCFDYNRSSRLTWIVFAPIVLLLVHGMLAGFYVLILVHV
ncbi:sodium/hydrogen exchanger 6 [Tanacetum coccineum]